MPSTVTISEGKLYREFSQPPVYVIHDGKKIWIPTPDALFAMGYNWSDVNAVPDGSLDAYPAYTISSDSPTPGSLVFPPDIPAFGSIFKSHYPIRPGHTTRLLSRSHVATAGFQEVQLGEVRGWLLTDFGPLSPDGSANPEGQGFDMSLSLLPDYEWLAQMGVNLSALIKVGNIVVERGATLYPANGPSSANALVTQPTIGVEINSWQWRDRIPVGLSHSPGDWLAMQAGTWPISPPFMPAGSYVSICGSLVSDNPHPSNSAWAGRCNVWQNGLSDPAAEDHWGRYTEIHPADKITLLPAKSPVQTVVGLTLWADPDQSSGLTVVLRPEAPKPPGLWRVAHEEILGPECVDPNPGAGPHYTRVESLGDAVRLTASTYGGHGLFAQVGRIRALYRLWWEPIPNTMSVSAGLTFFDNHQVGVSIRAIDQANTVLAGHVLDAQGTLLGTTESSILRQPACTVVNKTKTIWDRSGPRPKRITVHYEEWDYNPGSETFTVRMNGYQDSEVTVSYYHETSGSPDL